MLVLNDSFTLFLLYIWKTKEVISLFEIIMTVKKSIFKSIIKLNLVKCDKGLIKLFDPITNTVSTSFLELNSWLKGVHYDTDWNSNDSISGS